MSVNYSVVSRKNPMSPEAPKKFYPHGATTSTFANRERWNPCAR